MKRIVKKLYEGLFLVDSAEAAADWEGVNATIRNILGRAEAEIVSIRKWDERKLAYEIKGKTRGTYILCYFRVDGKRIRDIERDVHLSERIMRVLILSAEHMTQEDIEKGTPTTQAEKRRQRVTEQAEESTKVAAGEVEVQKRAQEDLVTDQAVEKPEQLEQSAAAIERGEGHPAAAKPTAADAGEAQQAEEDLEQSD